MSQDTEMNDFFSNHPAIEFIDLLIPDINGVIRGKRVTRDALSKAYKEGIMFPESTFALDINGENVLDSGLIWDRGDADCACFAIKDTLKIIPWNDKYAQVMLSMINDDGEGHFANPRQVLFNVLEQFKARDITPVVAVELECYFIDPERPPSGAPLPPLSPANGVRDKDTQVLSLENLDNYADVLEDIMQATRDQDIPADTILSEYAPGQFEINLHHTNDALKAADHAVLLKRAIRQTVKNHDLEATFMAKPYTEQSGSGTHIHVSLLDGEGRNILALDDDKNPNEMLKHALGGMMNSMADSMAIFAPHANSFRRFQENSYAPLAPCWGWNNRTTALRIPASDAKNTRIEHRVSGADANPYLVVAAILASILYGLDHKIDPGARTCGNAYEQHPACLPNSWKEALERCKNSTFLKEYLGQEFMHVYYHCKRSEYLKFEAVVTPTEYDWYLKSV